MATIIYLILAAWAGFIIGFMFKGWMDWRFRDYSGTIVIDKDAISNKVVYTLVLDDYPEKLEFKRVVILKVDTSDESSDRK